MDNGLFRKESIDNISSPDVLDDYIRVVNPSVWATLMGIIVLLLGVTIWGIFGHIDREAIVAVRSFDGSAYAYVNMDNFNYIKNKNVLTIDGTSYSYDPLSITSVKLSSKEDGGVLSILKDSPDEMFFCFPVNAKLANGFYEGKIVIESIRPIRFITN